MSVQRTLKITSKITIVASEGFFSSMHHDMSFHIPLVLHKLTANRTPKLPCSNSNWFNLQNKQTEKVEKIKSNLFYFINISIPWTFLTCEYKLPEWEKVFKQWSHENGFSPVCILICLFIFALDPKMILTQKGHLYFPAPSLIGSICKISRQKKVEKKILYSFINI